MALLIVESPTKAKTFNRILKGKDIFVFATMGHIRDLPSSKLSIDYTSFFKPTYAIVKKKEAVVEELLKLGKEHKEVIFATDLDREGESISYHAAYILGYISEQWPDIKMKKDKPIRRIIFHEITENALKEALANPQPIRLDLVKAQQARRILDRIVGYELSPLLWKKTGKYWLSAGRVQTVAIRLIVEREKEIKKFKSDSYFQIDGTFIKNQTNVVARLISKNNIPYEQKFTLQLFAGPYTYTKTTISSQTVDPIVEEIKKDTYTVSEIKETVTKRTPPPPYTTSSLQQDGFNRFGFSSKLTMRIAQDLYEQGHITYHRTDSVSLSEGFLEEAKQFITRKYGSDYVSDEPRRFKTKSRLAQEAHESIRPTKLGEDLSGVTGGIRMTLNHKKLYRMIYERALASQMKEASLKLIKIKIMGKTGFEFHSDSSKLLFDGFYRVLYPDYAKEHGSVGTLFQGDTLKLENAAQTESMTKPPPRYNEGSLIKILEEKGIGRPSTYAPTISLIQQKMYVQKEDRNFVPSILGISIAEYLINAFPKLFSLDFTAQMEGELDEIAEGSDFIDVLTEFNTPFQKELKIKKEDKTYIDIEEKVDEKCPKCGLQLTIRFSKYGKFLACSGYPTCKFTKPFMQIVPNQVCPKDGGGVVIRYTKSKRKFYGCVNYPKCDFSSWKLPTKQ